MVYLRTGSSDLIWSSTASLRASSPGRSGGGVGKGRRACNSSTRHTERDCLRNLNSTSNSPVAPLRLSCQISANQHEAEMSAKVNKHWKTRARGNDVITNVISANQHFALAFLMRIFKFQRHCCKLFFPFPPCHQCIPQSLLAGYSAAWPPTFLFLSFSTLCSSSLKRTVSSSLLN